jgi:quinol monooxygenase YgiN
VTGNDTNFSSQVSSGLFCRDDKSKAQKDTFTVLLQRPRPARTQQFPSRISSLCALSAQVPDDILHCIAGGRTSACRLTPAERWQLRHSLQGPEMRGTKVIITFEAKPDSATSLGAMLRQAKQDLPQVEGCNGARLLAAEDNPCVFTLVEEWESKSAHQAHIDRVVASGAWTQIASHLASEPISHYVNEL